MQAAPASDEVGSGSGGSCTIWATGCRRPHRFSGNRTPGPAPLYINALWDLTDAAGISAADLVEQAYQGGYRSGRRDVVDHAEELVMPRIRARSDVQIIPEHDTDERRGH